MTDGVDIVVVKELQNAAAAVGAMVEIIAPTVTGVTASDGSLLAAHHKIDGGPSVLFDAVAILPGEEGILGLLLLPPARDFAADAYAHYKFIGFSASAMKLFKKIGLPEDLDDGFIALEGASAAKPFLQTCGKLRFWDRPDGA